MNRISLAMLIACCVIGLELHSVLAQETKTAKAAEATDESQTIQEITVLGERTSFALRMQIEAAEEEVFAVFNELNNSDEMDISCTHEVYIGSHFKQRDCMPIFLKEAISKNIGDYVAGTDIQLTRAQIEATLYQRFSALEAMMVQLSQEHNSLYQSLRKLTNLAATLQLLESREAKED